MTAASPAPVRDRVRRHRERRRTGAVVLPFVLVADEVSLAELLTAAGLLAAAEHDDKAAIARAVGKLLDALVEQHRAEASP